MRKIFCKLLSQYLWQSLFLVKSHASSKIKVGSSLLFLRTEHVLIAAKIHFIPEHVSFSLFLFSLKGLVGSKHKCLSRHFLFGAFFLYFYPLD